ncbi:MAG: general secretion pathway protein GspK [Candidatus Omnitrophica bacterium]|nr:general secretion pathway protein GspK [Candidatus Omnitrophota bacterium]
MRGHEAGTILLVTLWLLAMLSFLAIAIGFRTTIDLKLVGYQIDELKAYEVAKAGIITAINEIARDSEINTDTLWECGVKLEKDEKIEVKFNNVSAGEGHFSVSVEDMERRININTAPRDVLTKVSAEITGEIADNIRAWRGDTGEGIPLGALSKDYSDRDYPCKGAAFDAPCELLLVKGVTAEMYNGGAEGLALRDIVTVWGPGEFKININTADQPAIKAVLAAYNLDTDAAANIVEKRIGDDKDIDLRDDNYVFTSLGQLKGFLRTAEGGDLDDTTLEKLNKPVSFNSNYFTIRSTGALDAKSSSRVLKKITCVVRRELMTQPPHKIEIIGWSEE